MPSDPASRRRLTIRILWGMGAGLVAGLALNAVGDTAYTREFVVEGVLHAGGAIFLASLKLLVVPLVFVSLVCGTAAMEDVTRLGRVGGKTLLLYLVTTAIAISWALLGALVLQPGAGFDLHTDLAFTAKEPPPLVDTLVNLFPSNPIQAMAEGNMLQIIVFSILFGLALTLAGAPGKRLLKIFQDLNEVVMQLVMILMTLAPYGVFCLVSKVFAETGFGAFHPLLLLYVTPFLRT